MTPDEVSQARSDASRWHASGRASQASVPTNAGIRVPVPPPLPQISSNPPPPTATTPAPQPAPPLKPVAKADDPKKNDIDNILDQVPQGLRKKFGF